MTDEERIAEILARADANADTARVELGRTLRADGRSAEEVELAIGIANANYARQRKQIEAELRHDLGFNGAAAND